tara:strand:- start:4062 stop:4436 length:375 start_codon:yes stop_codon:yes gene_type:complete
MSLAPMDRCIALRAAKCMTLGGVSSNKQCIKDNPCPFDSYEGSGSPYWRDGLEPAPISDPAFRVGSTKEKVFNASPLIVGAALIYYGSRSPQNVDKALMIGGVLLLPIVTGDWFFYHRLFKMGG